MTATARARSAGVLRRRWPLIALTAAGGAILLAAGFLPWYGIYVVPVTEPVPVLGPAATFNAWHPWDWANAVLIATAVLAVAAGPLLARRLFVLIVLGLALASIVTTSLRLASPPRLLRPERAIDTARLQRNEAGGPLAIVGALVICFGAAAGAALATGRTSMPRA